MDFVESFFIQTEVCNGFGGFASCFLNYLQDEFSKTRTYSYGFNRVIEEGRLTFLPDASLTTFISMMKIAESSEVFLPFAIEKEQSENMLDDSFAAISLMNDLINNSDCQLMSELFPFPHRVPFIRYNNINLSAHNDVDIDVYYKLSQLELYYTEKRLDSYLKLPSYSSKEFQSLKDSCYYESKEDFLDMKESSLKYFGEGK